MDDLWLVFDQVGVEILADPTRLAAAFAGSWIRRRSINHADSCASNTRDRRSRPAGPRQRRTRTASGQVHASASGCLSRRGTDSSDRFAPRWRPGRARVRGIFESVSVVLIAWRREVCRRSCALCNYPRSRGESRPLTDGRKPAQYAALQIPTTNRSRRL